ncbi:MAG: hypothetical protein NTX50_23320 [Candidatus Sumerlaeota bacterium]|nr:hypothetical protein [Candidatus Sumerlaeota bacterium]
MRMQQAVSAILFLLCMGMWLLMFYLIYALPLKEAAWKDQSMQLPLYLQMLITTGRFAQTYWILVFPPLFLVTAGFVAWFLLASFARKKNQINSSI